MDTNKIINLLEQEWDEPNGFFWKARTRLFDPKGLERVLAILESVEIKDNTHINRRLVSLLWFMPISLEWQKKSFQKAGLDIRDLEKSIHQIINLLYEILGIP